MIYSDADPVFQATLHLQRAAPLACEARLAAIRRLIEDGDLAPSIEADLNGLPIFHGFRIPHPLGVLLEFRNIREPLGFDTRLGLHFRHCSARVRGCRRASGRRGRLRLGRSEQGNHKDQKQDGLAHVPPGVSGECLHRRGGKGKESSKNGTPHRQLHLPGQNTSE